MPTSRHKDVEFMVYSARGPKGPVYSRSFAGAAADACILALTDSPVYLDILVYSKAGASWLHGEDGVVQYLEDPDASVFERIEITANSLGRIPSTTVG